MSNDSFSVTTQRSWFSRLGSAISGMVFGVILFGGSFVLLWWNEGRAIHREKTLTTGAKQVISVSAEAPLPENNGKLVHITGDAAATGPVSDPVFDITAEALKLSRSVEMYQWKEDQKSETKQKLGGGEETVTTYSYTKDWSATLIDSSSFQRPDGHSNPDEFPVESETFTAPGIHVGGFELSDSLIGMINNFTARPVTAEEAADAAEKHSEDITPSMGGSLLVGKDPQAPVVGDLRIRFEQAPAGPVSIIARQTGDTFEPFEVEGLGTIELLQVGTLSADAMFAQEQQGNVMLTWILRLAGFFMMLFGISLITGIFSVAASVIPFLGRIVGAGTGLLGLAVALPLTLITIAMAWLAYRPLIGIPLMLAAIACVVFGIRAIAKSRKPKPAA